MFINLQYLLYLLATRYTGSPTIVSEGTYSIIKNIYLYVQVFFDGFPVVERAPGAHPTQKNKTAHRNAVLKLCALFGRSCGTHTARESNIIHIVAIKSRLF